MVARQGKEAYILTHSKMKLDREDLLVFGIASEGYMAKQLEIEMDPD